MNQLEKKKLQWKISSAQFWEDSLPHTQNNLIKTKTEVILIFKLVLIQNRD